MQKKRFMVFIWTIPYRTKSRPRLLPKVASLYSLHYMNTLGYFVPNWKKLSKNKIYYFEVSWDISARKHHKESEVSSLKEKLKKVRTEVLRYRRVRPSYQYCRLDCEQQSGLQLVSRGTSEGQIATSFIIR